MQEAGNAVIKATDNLVRAAQQAIEGEEEAGAAGEGEVESGHQAVGAYAGEVVRVQWGRVIWITTRDQVLSPLLQGAVWCVLPDTPFSCY